MNNDKLPNIFFIYYICFIVAGLICAPVLHYGLKTYLITTFLVASFFCLIALVKD